MLKIIIYKTNTGKEPLAEWLDDLDLLERQIITTRIARLRLGNFGNCKPIKASHGIYEVVIDHGSGYPLYYGKQDSQIIILLIGGNNRSQPRDIEKAARYWHIYQGK